MPNSESACQGVAALPEIRGVIRINSDSNATSARDRGHNFGKQVVIQSYDGTLKTFERANDREHKKSKY